MDRWAQTHASASPFILRPWCRTWHLLVQTFTSHQRQLTTPRPERGLSCPEPDEGPKAFSSSSARTVWSHHQPGHGPEPTRVELEECDVALRRGLRRVSFTKPRWFPTQKRPKHELARGPPCCKCYYFLVVAPSHADRLSSPMYSALYRPLPEPPCEPQRPFRHPSQR